MLHGVGGTAIVIRNLTYSLLICFVSVLCYMRGVGKENLQDSHFLWYRLH